jgi:hypothetical protein
VNLVIGGAVASVLVLPFLLPYAELRQSQGLVRRLDLVEAYSATWHDYAGAAGRLHFDTWSERFWPGVRAALFPGFTALVLTLIAVGSGQAWRNRSLRLWVGIGLTGLLLSFGVYLPGYEWLHRMIPLLQGIRAVARFGYLALAGIAAIAGFTLAWMCQPGRLADPRTRFALRIGVLVLVTIEAARLPLGGTPPYRVPPIYRTLVSADAGAVVELPLPQPTSFADNAPYLLNSTVHWRPLVNGYSGFLPSSYRDRRTDLALFPAPEALTVLRRLGVRYAVIHRESFAQRGPTALAQLEASPGLRMLIDDGDIAIYRVQAEDDR